MRFLWFAQLLTDLDHISSVCANKRCRLSSQQTNTSSESVDPLQTPDEDDTRMIEKQRGLWRQASRVASRHTARRANNPLIQCWMHLVFLLRLALALCLICKSQHNGQQAELCCLKGQNFTYSAEGGAHTQRRVTFDGRPSRTSDAKRVRNSHVER